MAKGSSNKQLHQYNIWFKSSEARAKKNPMENVETIHSRNETHENLNFNKSCAINGLSYFIEQFHHVQIPLVVLLYLLYCIYLGCFRSDVQTSTYS